MRRPQAHPQAQPQPPKTSYWAHLLDKHLGTIVMTIGTTLGTIIGVCVTSYTALQISDKYMSYLPGSDEERRRLEKERRQEESKMLGRMDGFWFWSRSHKTEEGKKD